MTERTRAVIFADIESVLDRFAPDLAEEYRALSTPGRKPQRDADGFTESNKMRADLWEQMAERVAALVKGGMERRAADVQMIAEFMKRPTILQSKKGDLESTLWDFWDLKGRPEVRAILERRGVLSGTLRVPDNLARLR